MDIKKVDDKPMVIHTKKKFGLHIKSAPGAKARGRAGKEQETEEATRKEGQISGKQAKLVSYRKEKAGKGGADQKKTSATEVSAAKYSVAKAAVSVAAESALDETEGGSEVYHAYMVADTLAKTAANAASAGRNLYRSQAVREKQKRIKQQQSGSLLGEKESSQKLARKKAQAAAKKAAKETGKKTARETMQAAEKAAEKAAVKTAAAAVGTGAASIPGGIVAGELVGIAMDRREVKSFTRNRMARLSMEKLQQGEGQDSIGKALKDIIQKRVSMAAKYTLRYGSILLLALAVVVAVIALVVIAFLAIIYNSPLAVFFPSISSGETVQEVLSAYVSEFQDAVDRELADHAGYDTSEKIYVNFEGVGTPDNYYDIPESVNPALHFQFQSQYLCCFAEHLRNSSI